MHRFKIGGGEAAVQNFPIGAGGGDCEQEKRGEKKEEPDLGFPEGVGAIFPSGGHQSIVFIRERKWAR